MTAYALKDVLADPAHDGHAAAKEMMAKLESGELSLCGCLGPMYGEPHCPCKMKQLGLPLNTEARAEAAVRAQEMSANLHELFRKPAT